MCGIAIGTNDTHLKLEERYRLRSLMEMGLGISEIARRLHYHRTTIYRKIKRGTTLSATDGAALSAVLERASCAASHQFRAVV